MSNKLKILAKYFIAKYGFFKEAVPLEDGKVRIAPGWQRPGKKETELLDKKNRKEEYSEARKIIKNKVYNRHYGKTSVNYNIIYVPDFLKKDSLIYERGAVSVESFQERIDRGIGFFISDLNNLKSNISVEGKHERSWKAKLKLMLQCLYYLKANLKSNCINVLVNRYEDGDSIGFAAVDHDIGHKILDVQYDARKSFVSSIDPEYRMFHAFLKDFRFYLRDAPEFVEEGKINFIGAKEILENEDLLKRVEKYFYKALELLMIKGISMPGSISSENIINGNIEDLIYDIVVAYNSGGEDIGEIKLNGEDIDLVPVGYEKIKAEAIDPSLPHMNGEMKSMVKSMNDFLGKKLVGLVGKVFFLW